MSAAGYIYVIRARESGRIKIGHSRDPKRRLAQLQSASHEKLTLLTPSFPAPRFVERELHRVLRKHRVRGEWYSNAEDLTRACREIAGRIEGEDLVQGLA